MHSLMVVLSRVVVGLAVLASGAVRCQIPTVVRLEPADGAVDVDAARVTELVVLFDRAMSTAGFSFCGGGPAFPKVAEGQRPRWRDARTCVLPVALEADRVYSLALNCAGATNFRSAAGEPLESVAWRFVTRPAVARPAAEQRERNARAFDGLVAAVTDRYSYREMRAPDWAKTARQLRADFVAAPSDRAFALRVARAVEAFGDPHVWVDFDGARLTTSTLGRDALFRVDALRGPLGEVRQAAPDVLVARTDDGLGYLAIGSLSDRLDVAAVERELAGLVDVKGLVLDLRPNGGGDERKALRIAAWFVDGEAVYARHRVRTGAGDDGFAPSVVRTIRGRGDGEPRITAPVVVLQGPAVMSSAEAFVLMLRAGRDCTTVGRATFGSSGNPRPHRLDNGVELWLPSWRAERPDGTCFEGEGIAPDIAVDADPAAFERGDPILARGLEVLRQRLR